MTTVSRLSWQSSPLEGPNSSQQRPAGPGRVRPPRRPGTRGGLIPRGPRRRKKTIGLLGRSHGRYRRIPGGARFPDAPSRRLCDRLSRSFRWPALTRFNWALDYFDRIEGGESRTALWIVDESGAESRLSFADLSRRSNQVANHLRRLGVRRGERILLMLGNVVPLWETMLAAMKLGAVVIPSTTLLGPTDLADRIARGRVGTVIAPAAEAGKFGELAAGLRRIAIGAPVPGLASAMRRPMASPRASRRTARRRPAIPCCSISPRAPRPRPSSCCTAMRAIPSGHLSTMYWLGLGPGDIHLNISSPGWAKHAWSCFFAPWNAGATVFVHAASRFNAKETLRAIARHGVTTLCAPPTVWRLFVQEDLSAFPCVCASGGERGRASQPRDHRDRSAPPGTSRSATATARPRPRPRSAIRRARRSSRDRWDRPLPGYRVALLDTEDEEAAEGEVGARPRARRRSG